MQPKAANIKSELLTTHNSQLTTHCLPAISFHDGGISAALRHVSVNLQLIAYALECFDKPVSDFFSQLGDVDINSAADDRY